VAPQISATAPSEPAQIPGPFSTLKLVAGITIDVPADSRSELSADKSGVVYIPSGTQYVSAKLLVGSWPQYSSLESFEGVRNSQSSDGSCTGGASVGQRIPYQVPGAKDSVAHYSASWCGDDVTRPPMIEVPMLIKGSVYGVELMVGDGHSNEDSRGILNRIWAGLHLRVE